MTPEDLRAAARSAAGLLAQVDDPSRRVLDTDVHGVVGHVTDCLVWYAQDLAAGPVETSALQVSRRPDADLEHQRRALTAAAEVLARTIAGSSPGHRGWHEWGLPDPSGFAGIGCAEILLHTDDVATALGLSWSPPLQAIDATVTRLFPWVDPAVVEADPWLALRWASGRADLPGHDRVVRWRYHPAPLDEWDGRTPTS